MLSRDEYVSAIKTAFVVIETRVTLGLLASLPHVGVFFAHPIVIKIVEYFLKKLFTKKNDAVEMKVFFKYIDMRVGKQSSEFEAAAYENFRVQQTGDKDAIKKAEDNLWAKFEPFARLSS